MPKYNVQLVNIRNGVATDINPLTKSKNVSVTPQNNIPSLATDVEKVFNALGALSFVDTEINDSQTSLTTVWSSNKINSNFVNMTYMQYVNEDASVTPNCLPPSN